MLNQPTLYAQLMTEFTAAGILGPMSPGIANAISQGVTSHLQSSAVCNTMDTGVLGAGTGTVMIVFGTYAPQMLKAIMVPALEQQGEKWKDFCQAVSNAVANHVSSSLQFQTAVAPVSNGAGIMGFIQGVSIPVLTTTLYGYMLMNGMFGINVLAMCQAVAKGVITPLMTAQLQITDAGVPVFPFTPQIGSGFGKGY